jgi:hypothetical protein
MRSFSPKRQAAAEPTAEPERLVTLTEIADHPHTPVVTTEPVPPDLHPSTPGADIEQGFAIGLQKLPIQHVGTGVLSVLKTFRPSKETQVVGAHRGRQAHTLISSADVSIGEALYALRQVRDDALSARATADVDLLNAVIDRLS